MSRKTVSTRNGRIVWVSNDGHTWSGQSSPNNAVRLVRLNVSKFFDPVPSVTVEIDRIFGRASAGDRSGSIFDYGWPAVASNANGDIVVGSVRSNATIYPELRASPWFTGQPDLSPSVSLAKSSSALTAFHMAGASADPSTSGVYVAQQYGSSTPSWRIHVAKMLGEVLPDLIAMQVKAPATIAHGDSGTTTVIIMNQGDGPTPSSFGTCTCRPTIRSLWAAPTSQKTPRSQPFQCQLSRLTRSKRLPCHSPSLRGSQQEITS